MDLVDRQHFNAFRVAHDLRELQPIKNPKSKQVFYFDDFLGRTDVVTLQRNEDQRLVELMKEVAGNPNWRFVLTTREYILEAAKRKYEAFANPPLDFSLCIVDLGDYTPSIRAKILYNHIYFSDIPKEYKLALLEDRGYEAILSHQNYNPRIIDYMTHSFHACNVPATLYRQEFIKNLNNPVRIWDHAFRRQICEAARHLLMVLATMPYFTTEESLKDAFWAFYNFRRNKFGFAVRPGDWRDAVEELDGSFIASRKIGASVVLSFHNPSVKDFVGQFLGASETDVADLFRTAVFYEQYVALWGGVRGQRYRGISALGVEFLKKLAHALFGPSARRIQQAGSHGNVVGLLPYSPSKEARVEFFISVARTQRKSAVEPLVRAMLTAVSERWKGEVVDRSGLVGLIDALLDYGIGPEDPLFVSARRCLLAPGEDCDDYRAAADFCDKHPTLVSTSNRETLRVGFVRLAEEEADAYWDADPDLLRQVAADIEYVGEKFKVDTDRFAHKLNERAEEIEAERAEEDGREENRGVWSDSDDGVDDIGAMFDGLRSELKDR